MSKPSSLVLALLVLSLTAPACAEQKGRKKDEKADKKDAKDKKKDTKASDKGKKDK